MTSARLDRVKTSASLPASSPDADSPELARWRERDDARQSQSSFQAVILKALDATTDAIYLVDRNRMQIVHVNDAACRMQGLTREALIARGPMGSLNTSRAELEQIYDRIIEDGVPAKPLEMLRPRNDAPPAWLELRRHPVQSGDGWLIVTWVRDITETKQAQNRIVYLNRVYAMLSGINSLIVRVDNCDELFDSAVRIAATEGGFPMALIAMVDPKLKNIVPMASFGMSDLLLDGLKKRFGSMEAFPEKPGASEIMTQRALREQKPMVNNDLKADSSPIFTQSMLQAGVRAMVVLPLIIAQKSVGILALHAREADFFQDEELKLLTELASDVAFAVDHIKKQERLNYLAYYDVLTGLANRSLFLERVAQHIHSAQAEGHQLAVYLIDVERFKNINDSLGQSAGDELLRQIARWITQTLGDASLLARVGSNHFAMVRPAVRPGDNLEDLIEAQLGNFSEHPFHIEDAVFRITFKAGVALFPADGADADSLLKNAEAALKRAKVIGERYLFYTKTMTSRVAGKVTLENELRQALANGEFVLHYQPKMNTSSAKLCGAEALIRWNNPRTGLMPPGNFIPVLEETGLIHEVGRWAMRQAIADFLHWRASGLTPVRIAVNVSPLQLRRRGFIEEISQVIGIDSAAGGGLELEITEGVLMADVKHSIASLTAIRALGVCIAIDDFGTGFSSLAYLAKLPVDTLKIDQSFVVEMTTGAQGLALVSTIINLAHALKLKVVAEGVETEEQSRLLGLLGCDEMQGFLFSKALPRDIFETTYLTAAPVKAGSSAV